MSSLKNQSDNEKMIVFAAPSGSGKTTVVRHLLEIFNELSFSISATTREKREIEEDGKDYYFLSEDEFKDKITRNEFVEWVEVYKGRYYGTLKSEVQRLWDDGKFILFDIDVIGARMIKDQFGEKCLAVFVKPPSIEVLINRLKKRKTETEASLNSRIARFKEELTYEKYFDKTLINDDLEMALEEAEGIVTDFLKINTEEE